jgi:hypothetical protein
LQLIITHFRILFDLEVPQGKASNHIYLGELVIAFGQ